MVRGNVHVATLHLFATWSDKTLQGIPFSHQSGIEEDEAVFLCKFVAELLREVDTVIDVSCL